VLPEPIGEIERQGFVIATSPTGCVFLPRAVKKESKKTNTVRRQYPAGCSSVPQAVFLDDKLTTQSARVPGIAGFLTLHADGSGRKMPHV
jgi:hypothetical protein